jgi:hypothetical protein
MATYEKMEESEELLLTKLTGMKREFMLSSFAVQPKLGMHDLFWRLSRGALIVGLTRILNPGRGRIIRMMMDLILETRVRIL